MAKEPSEWNAINTSLKRVRELYAGRALPIDEKESMIVNSIIIYLNGYHAIWNLDQINL